VEKSRNELTTCFSDIEGLYTAFSVFEAQCSLHKVVVYPKLFNSKFIARNPAITERFVQRYWKLDWKNKYSHTKRNVAASIIQKWWLSQASNEIKAQLLMA
jgi:hypothetical protein